MSESAWKDIEKAIQEAEFVLVGLGEEFQEQEEKREQILQAYDRLEKMISGKPYFIVSQNEDELIFESKLLDFFIAAPFAGEERKESSEEQWNAYLNWLSATLNHKLCILELGAGFRAPQVIRWPFEKTALFHLKSILIRINESFPQLPEHLGERGISVRKNVVSLLRDI